MKLLRKNTSSGYKVSNLHFQPFYSPSVQRNTETGLFGRRGKPSILKDSLNNESISKYYGRCRFVEGCEDSVNTCLTPVAFCSLEHHW